MRTDWKDAIFSQRKIRLTNNSDGTVTPVDETVYTQEGDKFGADELNAIGEEVNEIKKSVSDGKTLIAAAITAKKVAAAATDTFAVLAQKISQITLGSGNAAKSDVLEGKTFTNDDGVEYTGEMADYSGTTQSASGSLDSQNSRIQLTVPATGKYSTASRLYMAYSTLASLIGLTAAKIANGQRILNYTGTYKGIGNAVEGDVVAGKTFSTASLSGAEGTLEDQSTYNVTDVARDAANSRINFYIYRGAYRQSDANHNNRHPLRMTYSTLANILQLTPDVIKSGETRCGVTGNCDGYVCPDDYVYRNGNNKAGFALETSFGDASRGGISNEPGGAYLKTDDGSFVHTWTSGQRINLTGVSTVRLTLRQINGVAEDFRIYLRYGYDKSSDEEGSINVSANTSFSEFNVDFDVSGVSGSKYIGFYFSMLGNDTVLGVHSVRLI